MRTELLSLATLFLLLSPTVLCRAQTDSGIIDGVVKDPTGAAIPQAKVQILNLGTGVETDLLSNATGSYTSPALIVGEYSVTGSKAGFSEMKITTLKLDAGARVETDIQLSIGPTTQEVTVQAAPPIDLTSGAITTTIDSRDAQELPLEGRNAYSLVALVPGYENGYGTTPAGFGDRGVQISAFRLSGGPPAANAILLDGVSNLQSYLGELAINPKADSVSQVRVIAGIVPAQFGFFAGGVVNSVTRSGTNKLHGAIYEYIRNDAIDAKGYFASTSIHAPELRYNQYGIALGGPILHDKLFLFANWEQFFLITRPTAFFTVPTRLNRGIGTAGGVRDFSDIGTIKNGTCVPNGVYNPFSATGSSQRTQFVNNQIPTTLLDPVAVALEARVYPLPNNTSGPYIPCTQVNNYAGEARTHTHDLQGLARADYQVNSRNSLFVRGGYYGFGTDNATAYGPVFNGRNDTLRNKSIVFGDTQVFSPHLFNDLRLSALNAVFSFRAGTAGMNIPGQIGLPTVSAATSPVVSNGMASFNTTVGDRATTQFQATDSLSLNLGRHAYQMGVDLRFSSAYNSQNAAPSGSFSFYAATTGKGSAQSTISGTGDSYATFLLGTVSVASDVIVTENTFINYSASGYLQDDWRVTPSLTLNLGLRYDYQQQPYEKNNGISNLDITKTNPATGFLGYALYANTNGQGRDFVAENYKDFAPRIGFAYSLTRDQKTVVRGGYAIYYPSTANNSYALSSGATLGFSSYTTNYTSVNSSGYVGLFKNGLPYAPISPAGAAGGPNAFLGQNAPFVSSHAPTSMTQIYTLGVQRQLPGSTVLAVTFLGARGEHFVGPPVNLNVLSPQYFGLGSAFLNSTVPNPYAGRVPGSLGGVSATHLQLLLPYPQYVAVTIDDPRNASYMGDYLYVQAQKRVSSGLQLLAAYTYGKLMDDPIYTAIGTTGGYIIGASTGVGSPQTYTNRAADYSVDGINAAHRITASMIYNLPIGHGQKYLSHSSLTSRLLGGFQISNIFSGSSGLPVGVTGANNQNIGGASQQITADRPNILPGVSPRLPKNSRTLKEWFNTSAYVNPADYTFGTAPRFDSKVRQPGFRQLDTSLFKTTPLWNDVLLELRIDAFNVLNLTNFGQAGTSFTAGTPANPSQPSLEGGTNINGNFGVISNAQPARIVQLSGKFVF